MKQYRYILVVVGDLIAPDEGHALMQVEMGHALTGRLLKFPNDVSIQIAEKSQETDIDPAQFQDNGRGSKSVDEAIKRFRDLTGKG